jgi:hypothetical protein
MSRVGGSTPCCEIGTKDPRLPADGVGSGEVLHRLGSCAGDDPQGVGDVPGIRRHEGERNPDQVRPRDRVVLDPRRDEHRGHGYKAHCCAQRHGARHTVSGRAPLD